MEYILIGFSAFVASLLTFYSGFGLGTLLMPVVAIFFPLPIAIGLTALVHLLHNVLKAGFLWSHIEWKIVGRFGLTALLAAIPGAWLLQKLSMIEPLGRYVLLSHTFEITILHLTVGALLIFFATLEMFPNRLKMKNLFLGGAVSGFFGGLSGNQGAFRSAFLIGSGLGKEAFIGTSAAIAVAVDIARLAIYGLSFGSLIETVAPSLMILAFISAFLGICLGMFLLKKITIELMQKVIVSLLYLLGALLIVGVI